jgi:hypothetical protein
VTHSQWTHRQRIGTFERITIPAHRIAFGDPLRELRREHGWKSQEASRTMLAWTARTSADWIVDAGTRLTVTSAELLTSIE